MAPYGKLESEEGEEAERVQGQADREMQGHAEQEDRRDRGHIRPPGSEALGEAQRQRQDLLSAAHEQARGCAPAAGGTAALSAVTGASPIGSTRSSGMEACPLLEGASDFQDPT